MKEVWLAVIPASLPTLAVLVGILLNQRGLDRLEARIDRLEGRLDSRIERLEARVERLETRFNEAILMLVNITNELDKRISRLEEKS